MGHNAEQGAAPIGYLVDLSNPDYRAWADEDDRLVDARGAVRRHHLRLGEPAAQRHSRASVGAGHGMNFEQLLCGGSVGSAQLPCEKLDDWNNGLTTLIADTTTALHKLGRQVIYNGIAPSSTRGPTSQPRPAARSRTRPPTRRSA